MRTGKAANPTGNSEQLAPQSVSERSRSAAYPARYTAFWNSLTEFIDFRTTSSIIGHVLPLSTGLKKRPRLTVVNTRLSVYYSLAGKELEARGVVCRRKPFVNHR